MIKRLFNCKFWNNTAVFNIVCWFISAIICSLQVLTICRGYSISDDGWYSYLLRDMPTDLSTNFQLIFGPIVGDRILFSRVLISILKIIAAIIFALGGMSLLKQWNRSDISFPFMLMLILAGQMYLGAHNNLQYYTVCLVLSELSVGLLFLSFCKRQIWHCILSGFFLFFVIPVKITSVIVFPIILFFLFFSNEPLKKLIGLLSGFLIGIITYFIFCESPQVYLRSFQTLFSSTIDRGDADYGIIFLIKWLSQAYVWHMCILLSGCGICYIFNKCSSILTRCLFFVCVGVLLIESGFLVFSGIYLTNPYLIFWLLFSIFLFSPSVSRKERLICLGLFFMPMCLCFGTDNLHRYFYCFIPFITFGALVLSNDNRKKLLLTTSVLICLLSSVWSYSRDNVLLSGSLKNQTESLRSIGVNQRIKVDKYTLSLYEFMQKHVNPGEDCLCDMFSWGFVSVLDQHPLSSSFRLKCDEAKVQLSNHVSNQIDINIFLYDVESDFGSKKELIDFARSLPDVEIIPFGYNNERTLVRYDSRGYVAK